MVIRTTFTVKWSFFLNFQNQITANSLTARQSDENGQPHTYPTEHDLSETRKIQSCKRLTNARSNFFHLGKDSNLLRAVDVFLDDSNCRRPDAPPRHFNRRGHSPHWPAEERMPQRVLATSTFRDHSVNSQGKQLRYGSHTESDFLQVEH